MSEILKNPGWKVAIAGTGINLALGVLYTWSIYQSKIVESIEAGGAGGFNWDRASVGDPYAICCLVFAFTMILAGKCQDLLGPRVTALIGGVLVGAGLLVISQSTSYTAWVLGFGVLTGAGIGFGYASATPPALKWFPGGQTGLIAGLVVAGFGLAPVYIAPLASYLVGEWGLQSTMMFFGAAFFIALSILSRFLKNPPEGYVPAEPESSDQNVVKELPAKTEQEDLEPVQRSEPERSMDASLVIKTASFWKLWFLYFIGAGAGLMVIGSVAGMAKQSMGNAAFIVVAIMAVGNASGRIIAGVVSDAMGKNLALAIFLALQSLNMFLAIFVVSSEGAMAFFIVLSATFIGFNYGTNLALFPAFCKGWWGLKSFGINYGLLFTSWGIGGFVMTKISGAIVASTGSYVWSFIVAGILLAIAAFVALRMKEPKSVA
ncbi:MULTISPECIES: OFA family MFS transporter [unclassified Oleiphilus]|jgi:MFS family permease|uniref:L-lactate MFS transporter n=7 Tax=Oleiphilus TaxID=141450 RepID=UPI0007C228DA|nr:MULTISPECIES: OFA family MFS transporter [unclassified Oleiphilus]KZY49868.1 MFS transporter [Oleiphilus sp. HI0050]KZY84203.1 MFS transporter [Oleiphilus sp. HI0069]KZZ33763.1 MFS transporter [Oleiphilus sp. HI0085]KZY33214.1 MFS transporter [Oleiphilus sp. HI0043]KZZ31039.1 MFS transporter [Oleiphilus sp. HI0086]